jgi:translation initiation factor IF-3
VDLFKTCQYRQYQANFFLSGKEGKAINNSRGNDVQINGQIRDPQVRVIGQDGEQLGVMSSREALQRAQDAGVDLVKVSPMADPPVCKIIDFGKYRYEQARRKKEARRKQHIVDIKEVRMTPNIDTNDLNTKISAARKFLEKGDKVKVTIRFRGREMAHMNASRPTLENFAKQLEDIAVIEKQPKIEGRNMSIVLGQKKK